MSKVIFKFDKEKDLYNHWEKSQRKSPSWINFNVDPKIKQFCEEKDFEECKKELSKLLKPLQESRFILNYISSIKNSWELIEREFFNRMDKIMKNKYLKEITAYLTTLTICPYNPKEPSFMFSFFTPLTKTLQVCGHEIMHLYFHEFYWDDIEKEIGKNKTSDLKESLTVILNLEFKDLWYVLDRGYEAHKDLREFISQEWKKEKDFEKLLLKCINYLK